MTAINKKAKAPKEIPELFCNYKKLKRYILNLL